MESLLADYSQTGYSLGGLALLMLIQALIGDLLAIRAKHVPGTPVPADHGNLLFRATRAVANTNENVAMFILLVAFAVALGGNPSHVAMAAWGYVGSRVVYALAYYFDLRTFRSIVFGVSLLMLGALLVIGLLA